MTRAVPNIFGSLINPSLPNLDNDFAALTPTVVLPCNATGTNLIVLAPVSNLLSVTAYTDKERYSFIALNTSSASVTMQIGALAALAVYKAGGVTQAASGDVVGGQYYDVAYLASLNSGAGGFVIVSAIPPSGANTVLRSYIAGMTMSNDVSTPNSVLDVAAGQATDSTNAVYINLSAITKSTAGSWVVGNAQNGMGAGLTIGNSTWYHVFAIINNNVADVYFDTSPAAANSPSGTTAFRRIGSFLTNSSAQIIAFVQLGERFLWSTVVSDYSINNTGTSAFLQVLTVPTGVKTIPLHYVDVTNDAGAPQCYVLITSPDQADTAPGATLTMLSARSSGTMENTDSLTVWTNTSAQVRLRMSASASDLSFVGTTFGWIDLRGTNL